MKLLTCEDLERIVKPMIEISGEAKLSEITAKSYTVYKTCVKPTTMRKLMRELSYKNEWDQRETDYGKEIIYFKENSL